MRSWSDVEQISYNFFTFLGTTSKSFKHCLKIFYQGFRIRKIHQLTTTWCLGRSVFLSWFVDAFLIPLELSFWNAAFKSYFRRACACVDCVPFQKKGKICTHTKGTVEILGNGKELWNKKKSRVCRKSLQTSRWPRQQITSFLLIPRHELWIFAVPQAAIAIDNSRFDHKLFCFQLQHRSI